MEQTDKQTYGNVKLIFFYPPPLPFQTRNGNKGLEEGVYPSNLSVMNGSQQEPLTGLIMRGHNGRAVL